MKRGIILVLGIVLIGACNWTPEAKAKGELLALNSPSEAKAFHDFVVRDLNEREFAFSQLKGKRILIVNTASKCGYTPQYEGLQALYKEYGGDNFTIIGFPCNQFMNQEPGSNKDIADFCQKNYGVEFPMMDKIDVKGDDQHPVYAWLTDKGLNGMDDASVSWNFNKFLIDENGKWVAHYGSHMAPQDEDIANFAAGK